MLSQFNIFNRYFTAADVSQIYCGGSPATPVVRWNQLLDKVVGTGNIYYTRPSGVPSHACSGSTTTGSQCGPSEAVVKIAANGGVTCASTFPTALNSTVDMLRQDVAKHSMFQTKLQSTTCSSNTFVTGVGASGMPSCSGPDLSSSSCSDGKVLTGLTSSFGSECTALPSPSDDFDLSFEHLGVEAYILAPVAIPDLTAFSASFWIKGPFRRENYLVSYATTGSDNSILLRSFSLAANLFGSTVALTVSSQNLLLNNDWHHCIYTWSAASGALSVYVDGAFLGSTDAPTSTIPGGGSFLIGQEQDGFPLSPSRLDPAQRFQGVLSGFTFLTAEVSNATDVASLFCGKANDFVQANTLFSWADLKNAVVGNGIYPIEPSTRPGCAQTCPDGEVAQGINADGTVKCASAPYAIDFQHTSIDDYVYPLVTIPSLSAFTIALWWSE